MGGRWFYARDGHKYGPFGFDQLRELTASGVLAPADRVLDEATGAWASAGTVAGLFPPTADRPPPVCIPLPTPSPPPVEPAGPPRPAGPGHAPRADRSRVWNAVSAVAVLLSIPAWCLGEFVGPGLTVAAGLVWVAAGVRAAATGAVPTLTGRVRRRSTRSRVLGAVVGLLGLALAGGGLARLAADRPRGPTPAGGPAGGPVAGWEAASFGGGQEVRYPAGLREPAERLGRALVEVGYFDGAGAKGVGLDRRGDAWAVEIVLTAAALDDPRTAAGMDRWVAVRVAALAFPGDRVEVTLCDPDRVVRASSVVEAAGRSPITDKAAVYHVGGAGAEGDRLAELLKGRVEDRVSWVILLARRPTGWVITPLNLAPGELTPAVRRSWARVARDAGRAFGAEGVQVEVLGDDYRPVAFLSEADLAD